MGSKRPYFRRARPAKQSEAVATSNGTQVDLSKAWPLPPGDPVASARQLFDTRAAAIIRAAVGIDGVGGDGPPRIWPLIDWIVDSKGLPLHWAPAKPPPRFEGRDLLEFKWYDGKAPTIHVPRVKCLAALAYLDYFPDNPARGLGLRSMVSRAVLGSSPGWCGTFGPGVDGTFSLKGEEGNYDMSEMHLLAMAYGYFDELSPAARELLIKQLLARGRAHRPDVDDTFTSGRNPNDWRRAGFVSPLGNHIDIGETENHILMIVTARYLTNQLLFQRDPSIDYDNRRNGGDDYPSCTSLLMSLLHNTLRGDFSEYNAKSYQSETRWALLNLCTYAYDYEVRLGARMVLDYLSAHMAVSSNDLRRLLPYRRRHNAVNSAHTSEGFMTVDLLDWNGGSDPMPPYFALQAGNLRACELPMKDPNQPVQSGIRDSSGDLAIEIASAYRLPPSIQDLFVNDQHRRFFQRLHRTPRDEVGGNRNCDNMEIYAGSPSYLITAGGEPALWAIDPGIAAVIAGDDQAQQLGVAVTTSFMPIVSGVDLATAAGVEAVRNAYQMIQFGEFSTITIYETHWKVFGKEVAKTTSAGLKRVANYGVAPDFACGHQVHLPAWVDRAITEDANGMPIVPQTSRGFCFVNKRVPKIFGAAGFYLAIYQETPGGLAMLEAFDCVLHPKLAFEDFKAGVLARNAGLALQSNVPAQYTTTNGDQLAFVIWKDGDGGRPSESGAEVLSVAYGDPGSLDAMGGADRKPAKLLNGTIMNSPGEAVVEITNPLRGTKITLDWSNPARPRRQDSETGEFEVAGGHSEVWVDFAYPGPSEGDACRPFSTIAAAVGAVEDGGTLRIVPGSTAERGVIGGAKRFRIVAAAGDVTIGSAVASAPAPDERVGAISNFDVWVECDWFDTAPEFDHVPLLFGTLGEALDAVAQGGVIHIQPGDVGLINVNKSGIAVNIAPGTSADLGLIGHGKRCTLVAPIGGVTITHKHLARGL